MQFRQFKTARIEAEKLIALSSLCLALIARDTRNYYPEVNQPELVPYWCLGKEQTVKTERIIPMHPVSKDQINYDRLKSTVSV